MDLRAASLLELVRIPFGLIFASLAPLEKAARVACDGVLQQLDDLLD